MTVLSGNFAPMFLIRRRIAWIQMISRAVSAPVKSRRAPTDNDNAAAALRGPDVS